MYILKKNKKYHKIFRYITVQYTKKVKNINKDSLKLWESILKPLQRHFVTDCPFAIKMGINATVRYLQCLKFLV